MHFTFLPVMLKTSGTPSKSTVSYTLRCSGVDDVSTPGWRWPTGELEFAVCRCRTPQTLEMGPGFRGIKYQYPVTQSAAVTPLLIYSVKVDGPNWTCGFPVDHPQNPSAWHNVTHSNCVCGGDLGTLRFQCGRVVGCDSLDDAHAHDRRRGTSSEVMAGHYPLSPSP